MRRAQQQTLTICHCFLHSTDYTIKELCKLSTHRSFTTLIWSGQYYQDARNKLSSRAHDKNNRKVDNKPSQEQYSNVWLKLWDGQGVTVRHYSSSCRQGRGSKVESGTPLREGSYPRVLYPAPNSPPPQIITLTQDTAGALVGGWNMTNKKAKVPKCAQEAS